MFKDLVKWQWNLEGWERYGQTDDGDLIIMLIGLNVEVKGDSTISGGDFLLLFRCRAKNCTLRNTDIQDWVRMF